MRTGRRLERSPPSGWSFQVGTRAVPLEAVPADLAPPDAHLLRCRRFRSGHARPLEHRELHSNDQQHLRILHRPLAAPTMAYAAYSRSLPPAADEALATRRYDWVSGLWVLLVPQTGPHRSGGNGASVQGVLHSGARLHTSADTISPPAASSIFPSFSTVHPSPIRQGMYAGTMVAVKEVAAGALTPSVCAEAALLAGLRHPAVLHMYGCCAHDSHLYIITELCDTSLH